ncbi:MAG: putative site-specific recombinase, resolvase family [Microgenomates group bacterium Gr01-1014_7]|nr:MAG: putative site-specific recombinase, resolvase family [Microgenomates group bacterium Gr01-1014_7]
MRVALQGRVSTEEQKEGKTIDTQKVDTRGYASLNEHEIVKEYWEEGVSGATLEREKMDELRADAKASLFDALISVRPDRLSREQVDQLTLLKELDQLGIKAIFTSQPGIENLEGVQKIMIRGNNAMYSEIERVVILERTSSARKRVVGEGNVMTSRSPYGLNYVRHSKDDQGRTIKRGHFIPNPQEIENLKLILNWAKDGWSQRRIIKELFERKIPTRNGKLKWQKSTIGKILGVNLSVYSGIWYYMKYQHTEPKFRIKNTKYPKTRKSSRTLRDKSEWLQVKLPPELSIISPEEVELIRRRQKENTTLSIGNTKHQYLVQRRVFCNKCNGGDGCDNFHGVSVYRCRDKKRRFPEPTICSGGSIKSETLDDAVWSDIKRLILQPTLIKEAAKKFVESKKDDGVVGNYKLEELARKRKELERQKERIDDGFREGLYLVAEAKSQKVKVNELLSQLDQQENEEMVNYKKAGQIDYNQLTVDIESLCKDLGTVLHRLSFEEKKQIVQWLALKVSVGDHHYSIEGSLPIYNNVGNANSRPLSFDVGPAGHRQDHAVPGSAGNSASSDTS